MTIRAILADDEELARSILREYLSKEPDIEILTECANGLEAVKAVNEHKPDVLFLDVQMPKLDGFEVLELTDRNVAVVFVTAFDQFAVRAFEAAAVDYLLKPFNPERLRAALERIREKVREPRTAGIPSDLRQATRPPGEYLERIVVKDGARVHVVTAARLDYIEAQDDYVALRSEGKTWLKQQTISNLEGALDPRRFLRIHRSYLVNIDRVVRIDAASKDTWEAVLRDGSKIPVSRAGYSRFRQMAGNA